MQPLLSPTLPRREFLSAAAVAGGMAAGLSLGMPVIFGNEGSQLAAGEGTADTTPPEGIELAGFHYPPGNERVIKGIRQPTAARALVLKCGDTKVVLVSLDIIGVSQAFSADVRRRVSEAIGVPAENVRICATHTHSMPTFVYLRQWGKIPQNYLAATKQAIVTAAQKANDDLAPAEMQLGHASAVGGNFNRTTSTWKTDAEFTAQSTDAERWLDTRLHTLRFTRGQGKGDLLWYHFSAHPVCYTDALAGPDWVGGVMDRIRESEKLTPSFLQGHAGDVNPGDGSPWIGDPAETVAAVTDAIRRALSAAKTVRVTELRTHAEQFHVPFDRERLKNELQTYRENPEKCQSGPWVDAAFAKAWYDEAQHWKLDQKAYATPFSALRLGPVAMLFHSTELYSYYGLAIRAASPMEATLVVGYADDVAGYVTDPKAYEAGEYAAVVVPRILNLPPFEPTAGRQLSAAAGKLLAKLSS
jgi:neutral ceramidase